MELNQGILTPELLLLITSLTHFFQYSCMCIKLVKQVMVLWCTIFMKKVVGTFCKRKLAYSVSFYMHQKKAGWRMDGGLFE